MIRLRHLSKSFTTPDGTLRAVDNVSLHIEAGQIFGIVGFSGAGKSTLLRMINLLEKPDPGGEVIVNGRELQHLSGSALNQARHGIGMVFQHFNLLANRDVYGNISLPLELAGVPKAQRQRRIEECLDFVGLTPKARAFPAKLSGGQKQRVGIARALATSPKILLCDEPTSALDPHTTSAILDCLRTINRSFGTTIVIVTHEMHVVSSFCQKVAVMEEGAVVEAFGIGDLGYQPRTDVARFLQQAQRTARLHEDLQQTAI